MRKSKRKRESESMIGWIHSTKDTWLVVNQFGDTDAVVWGVPVGFG